MEDTTDSQVQLATQVDEDVETEQVQNAVKFLSNRKVKGSPIIDRRSFLEKKGLTKEEIDEAFRRVPDPTPSYSSSRISFANQEIKNEAPGQAMQRCSSHRIARMGTFSSFRWYHTFLTVGVLVVSGAATAAFLKSIVILKFKYWLRKIEFDEEEKGSPNRKNLTPTFAEKAVVAAKAADAAASNVALASQEMVSSISEDKKYFEDLTKLLEIQVHDIKLMSNAIKKLEGNGYAWNVSRNTQVEYDDYRVSGSSSRVPQESDTNGKVDVDSRSVRSSPPAESAPPHPKSYMEIMAMVQRGEKPSNIRDINDMPPNPNQPIPRSSVTPKAKPWEEFQPPQTNGHSTAEFQDNPLNGTSSSPVWQQKTVKITDTEFEDEQKMAPSGILPTEGPGQWVPPPSPQVAMAEAAAAIRQLKKSPIEELADDQVSQASNGSNGSDELQRVTKISEAVGLVDANGGDSGPLSINELPKGEEITYLEA